MRLQDPGRRSAALREQEKTANIAAPLVIVTALRSS
jgi:hypothetical protein